MSDITTQTNQETVTIELGCPIMRGKSEIKEVTLCRPLGNALLGVSMMDLATAKTDAIKHILPRISEPVINGNDFAQMDGADIMDLGMSIASFFTKAKFAAMSTTADE